MSGTQSELRLARLIDERELVRGKHENKLAEIEAREDKSLTDSDAETLKIYREKSANLDMEIKDLSAELEATNKAIEESKAIRRYSSMRFQLQKSSTKRPGSSSRLATPNSGPGSARLRSMPRSTVATSSGVNRPRMTTHPSVR